MYRAQTQEEAMEKFDAFLHRVPNFVQMVKSMYTIPGLQKLCDILAENPSWSLAHLVAHFGLVEYLAVPQVVELIDYPDHLKYMIPFQLAIKAKNIEMVKLMIGSAKLDHLDYNSDSIFHYAANTSKEMITILTNKSTVNLNHCNLDGYTPLHAACLNDNPDCVNALLCAGADVNISATHTNNKKIINPTTSSKSYIIFLSADIETLQRNARSSKCRLKILFCVSTCPTGPTGSVAEFFQNNANKLCTQDMKNGGTPLHWAGSREVMESLIKRGCDINSVDFNGRTALHVMVAKNKLECVVSLLAHEGDIDIRDKDGNTPLHIAVDKKLIPIVQCLVVFGCDMDAKNKNQQSSRHMVSHCLSRNVQFTHRMYN